MKDWMWVSILVAFVVGLCVFVFYAPMTNSSFYNDETLICIDHKDWGFIKTTHDCYEIEEVEE